MKYLNRSENFDSNRREICAKIKNFCCAFLMSFIYQQSPLITIIDHSSSSRSSLARLPGHRPWPWPSMGHGPSPARVSWACLTGRLTVQSVSRHGHTVSHTPHQTTYLRTYRTRSYSLSTHGATGAERPQLFN